MRNLSASPAPLKLHAGAVVLLASVPQQLLVVAVVFEAAPLNHHAGPPPEKLDGGRPPLSRVQISAQHRRP